MLLLVLVSSCSTEDVSNQDLQVNANLTGTWISTSVEDTVDNLTGQTSRTTVRQTLYITETDELIQLHGCEYYSHPVVSPVTVLKNDNLLESPGILAAPYSIVSPIQLNRTFVETSGAATTTSIQTLTKVSTAIDLSRGALQLNGPVSADIQSHVCLVQTVGAAGIHGCIQLDLGIQHSYADVGGE